MDLKQRILSSSTTAVLAAVLLCSSVGPARATPAQYLEEAQAAAGRIQLAGDQSAALRAIALTTSAIDAPGAMGVIARIRRPSDAACSLGAAAVVLANSDRETASEAAATAGRLLMRISSPEQRHLEQMLLLREIAVLGEDALEGAPEIPPEEAQLAIVLGLAESDPRAALALLEGWELTGSPRDRATAVIAEELASVHPDEALELAAGITSARIRDAVLWRLAEQGSPEEASGIALRIFDPVVRSGAMASVSARQAGEDPAAAPAPGVAVDVAPDSAIAQMAVAMAETSVEQALGIARGLPERPRSWALARIAVLSARRSPEVAEGLLSELNADSEVTRLVVAAMAETDAERALRLARRMPPGAERDAALAAVARSVALRNRELTEELLWEVNSARWRARALQPLAVDLASSDCDAATSLLGLVVDRAAAGRIRADIAAAVAVKDSSLSARLLESLPPSDYRNDAALQAAAAVLRKAGQPETASRLASIGLDRDLALRWLLPELARAETRSPSSMAEQIEGGFPRALALVDVARDMLDLNARARPAPDRARQIRPIVEWEGR